MQGDTLSLMRNRSSLPSTSIHNAVRQHLYLSREGKAHLKDIRCVQLALLGDREQGHGEQSWVIIAQAGFCPGCFKAECWAPRPRVWLQLCSQKKGSCVYSDQESSCNPVLFPSFLH